MKLDLKVDLHHLARIEGHGNIAVRVEDGELTHASWDIVETPRFFEVMLKGKHYSAASVLSSRICGICSISHSLVSLQATEDALGVEIPEAAARLRLLAKHGETLQSHYLHLFFLAAPDYLGQPSVLPLISEMPEVVTLAARLKGLANRLCDAVAGRTTHPTTFAVGGVTYAPPADRLSGLRDELIRSLEDLTTAVQLFETLELPDFVRQTEFVSLGGEPGAYPFLTGKLVSTDGLTRERHEYLSMTNEYVDRRNTSKLCKLSRDSFAVGPLARFNNNHAHLRPEASALAAQLGLEPICHNPFMSNLARLVECVHLTHEAVALIESLISGDLGETRAPVEPRAGEGVGAVEAPRGILYHHYAYDDDGRITKADCVIPTTQNNANIHHDLSALVLQFAREGMTDEEMELLCSKLVRAYDPCVSCSVH